MFIQIYRDLQQELELSFDIFIQNMFIYLNLSNYNSFVPLFGVCYYYKSFLIFISLAVFEI